MAGYFSCQNPHVESMTPNMLGYWILRWSDECAHTSQRLFSETEMGKDPSLEYLQSFSTYLQLLALSTAMHWAYVVFELRISEECVEAMKEGQNASIKEFHDPFGKPLSQNLIDIFNSGFQRYFKAISEDRKGGNEREKGVLKFGLSNLASRFVESIEFYSFSGKKEIPDLVQTYLDAIISSELSTTFESLKVQGLTFSMKEESQYRLAAEQGDAVAQFNLALSYTKGEGVAQDFKEAAKWFSHAAEQGVADAQFALGAMYADGHGVSPSPVVAYALFSLSLENVPADENPAAAYRRKLVSSMATRDINSGQELTREVAKPGNLLRAINSYLHK